MLFQTDVSLTLLRDTLTLTLGKIVVYRLAISPFGILNMIQNNCNKTHFISCQLFIKEVVRFHVILEGVIFGGVKLGALYKSVKHTTTELCLRLSILFINH